LPTPVFTRSPTATRSIGLKVPSARLTVVPSTKQPGPLGANCANPCGPPELPGPEPPPPLSEPKHPRAWQAQLARLIKKLMTHPIGPPDGHGEGNRPNGLNVGAQSSA